MSYLVIIICLSLSVFCFLKWKHGLSPLLFWSTYAVKILAGIAFWYIYTYIYGEGFLTEDAGCYFREGQFLNSILFERPVDFFHMMFGSDYGHELIASEFGDTPYARYADTSSQFIPTIKNIIHLNALLLLPSGNEMLGMFALFIQLSFMGMLYFWKEFRRFNQINPYFILLILAPSLLLWTSSNLKESVAIWALALLCLSWMQAHRRIFHLSLGALLLLLFKPYWLIVLVFAFVISVLIMMVIRGSMIQRIVALVFFLLPFATNLPKTAVQQLSDKQFDFINLSEGGYHFSDSIQYYFVPLEQDTLFQSLPDGRFVFTSASLVETRAFSKVRISDTAFMEPYQDTLELNYIVRAAGVKMPLKRIDRNWTNIFGSTLDGFLNMWLRIPEESKKLSIIPLIAYAEGLAFFLCLIFILLLQWRHGSLTYNLPWWLTILLLTIMIGCTSPVFGAIVRYRIPIQFVLLFLFLRLYIKPLKI